MKVKLQPIISPTLSSSSLLLLLPSSSYFFNTPSNLYRVYSQIHTCSRTNFTIILTSPSLPPPSPPTPLLPHSSSSSLLHYSPSRYSCFYGLLGFLSSLSGVRYTLVAPHALAELFKTIHLMIGPRLKNVKIIDTGEEGKDEGGEKIENKGKKEGRKKEKEGGNKIEVEGKVIYEDALLRVQSWQDLCFFAEVKQNETILDKVKLSKFEMTRSQISQLRERGEVTFKGGRKVFLKQVLKDISPLSFLLLDIQTPQQLDLITKIGLPQNFLLNDPQNVPIVIHFENFRGKRNVFRSKKYQEFVESTLKNATHLVVGEDFEKKERWFRMVEELAKLFPEYFNHPYDFSKKKEPIPSSIVQPIRYSFLTSNSYWESGNIHYFKMKKKTHITDFTFSPPSPSSLSSSSTLPSPSSSPPPPSSSFLTPPSFLHPSSFTPPSLPSFSLLLLGTSSSVPTPFRSLSSHYLKFKNGPGILLDIGEGSAHQLELYGLNEKKGSKGEVGEELGKKVGLIFISHLHADHHLGLVEFLIKRVEKGWDEPLFVVMPYILFNFVFEQLNVLGKIRNVEFIASDLISVFPHPFNKKNQIAFDSNDEEEVTINNSYSLNPPSPTSSLPSSSRHPPQSFFEFLKKNDITIETVPSDHCQESYSIVLNFKKKFKVVYSGDTRPYPPLIKYGRNCDLLIHEATYVNPPSFCFPSPLSSPPPFSSSSHSSSHPSSFISSKHSTRSEAESVGRKMNAWRTILTHFGEEDEVEEGRRIEGKKKEELAYKERVVIGCDGMWLNEKNINEAPRISREIASFYNKISKEL